MDFDKHTCEKLDFEKTHYHKLGSLALHIQIHHTYQIIDGKFIKRLKEKKKKHNCIEGE